MKNYLAIFSGFGGMLKMKSEYKWNNNDINVLKSAVEDFEYISGRIQSLNIEKPSLEKASALLYGYNMNKKDKCFDVNTGYINVTVKLGEEGLYVDQNSIEVYNKDEEWLGVFSKSDIEGFIKEHNTKKSFS